MVCGGSPLKAYRWQGGGSRLAISLELPNPHQLTTVQVQQVLIKALRSSKLVGVEFSAAANPSCQAHEWPSEPQPQ